MEEIELKRLTKESEIAARIIIQKYFENKSIALINNVVKTVESCQDPELKFKVAIEAHQVIENMRLFSGFFRSFVENGPPEELIFITGTGKKIDVLTKKQLNENELINIFLDTKTKCDE